MKNQMNVMYTTHGECRLISIGYRKQIGHFMPNDATFDQDTASDSRVSIFTN